MNSSFCVLPWAGLTVNTNGSIAPCCLYNSAYRDSDGVEINVDTKEFENILNSKDAILLRQKMWKGEMPNECQVCYKNEEFNGPSLRLRYNSILLNDNIKQRITDSVNSGFKIKVDDVKLLDLRLGNLCNLKCRSCSSTASSMISSEMKTILKSNPEHSIIKFYNSIKSDLTKINDDNLSWTYNSKIIENIINVANNVKVLYLAGGEPTINPVTTSVIKNIKENGNHSNIVLHCNTNIVKIDSEFYDIATHFKVFRMIISIDGFNDLQEYLRPPAKWDTIDRNLRKLVELNHGKSNKYFTISPVIQASNLNKLTDILDYVESINMQYKNSIFHVNLNILHYPKYLSIDILPKSFKQECWEKINAWFLKDHYLNSNVDIRQLEQIKNMCNQDQDLTGAKMFLEYTDALDNARNQSFKKVCPEVYQVLNEFNS